MIYIYLVMFLLFSHFSFNFKDLGYFNRATMRPLVFKLAITLCSFNVGEDGVGLPYQYHGDARWKIRI